MGGGSKTADAYIADAWTYHIGGIDGLHGNLRTDNGELQQILDALTDNSQMHYRTFRTAQALHNLLFRHLHARNGGVIDGDDAVARYDAHLLGGTVGNGLDDEQRVLNHVELHADALEIATEGLVGILYLLGGHVTGVGIKFVKHPSDSVLGEFLLVDAVYIKICDCHLSKLQLA